MGTPDGLGTVVMLSQHGNAPAAGAEHSAGDRAAALELRERAILAR